MPNAKEITWDVWKDVPMPALNKGYTGQPAYTMLKGGGDDWPYKEDFLEDFEYEVMESRKRNLSLMQFQEWIALEQFFGQRLAFEQFWDLKQFFKYNEEVGGEILELGGKDPLIPAIRAGDSMMFTSSCQSFSELENEKVAVIRLLTPAEADIFDIGPIFKVETSSGEVLDAFWDELSPINNTSKIFSARHD